MSSKARAIEVWSTFHDKDPRQLIEVGGNPWPEQWGLSGEATRVYYLSDKWHQDGKFQAYYHDHAGGVELWEPDGAQTWLTEVTERPARGVPFSNAAVLGFCLGWEMRRVKDERKMETSFKEGSVLLCSSPSGKVLFAIGVRDEEVMALFCGGKLDVRAEGIVG